MTFPCIRKLWVQEHIKQSKVQRVWSNRMLCFTNTVFVMTSLWAGELSRPRIHLLVCHLSGWCLWTLPNVKSTFQNLINTAGEFSLIGFQQCMHSAKAHKLQPASSLAHDLVHSYHVHYLNATLLNIIVSQEKFSPTTFWTDLVHPTKSLYYKCLQASNIY